MAADADLFSEEATAVRRAVKCCPECAQHYSADSMFCPFDGSALEEMTWVAPTDPTVDPVLGTLIDGRYRVERVLGEGGTGTVYEVLHESLHRRFAMKVLRRDVARDPALASRFIQEARATASLKHPHIVSITDFGRLPDKTPYFVMERLVGKTLAEVCHIGGQLPMERAVRVVMQVADALSAAHEAGIVHRDLKPENIFLVGRIDGDGRGGDDVRVVDFGAAKIAGASRITKTGIVFGTPHYMSPEQASGQPVDHRADIYALGVIMYELFTGRLPFQADTLMGVLTKHMFVEPPPFSETPIPDASRLLGALEAVTMRTMAKKPENRFQTMAALGAELERTISFGEAGRVELAPGWTPQPRAKSVHPPAELSRALEGPERRDVYPSEEVPTVPGTSLRSVWAGLAAVAIVCAVVGMITLRKGSAAQPVTSAPPITSASSPAPSASVAVATPPAAPSASATAPAIPAAVHLTTIPPFAEVWQSGRRIGTTPIDLPVDPDGHPVRCTLHAPGYAETPVSIDSTSAPSLAVKLDALPASPHPRKPPAPATKQRHSVSGELVDPF